MMRYRSHVNVCVSLPLLWSQVTNNAAHLPSTGNLVPSLGTAWSSVPHVRIMLEKDGGGDCGRVSARVTHSSYTPTSLRRTTV